VATLPASNSISGSFDFTSFTASSTLVEWPWALSMAITSTLAAASSWARSRKISSGADGRAYAQASLRIFGGVGYFSFF